LIENVACAARFLDAQPHFGESDMGWGFKLGNLKFDESDHVHICRRLFWRQQPRADFLTTPGWKRDINQGVQSTNKTVAKFVDCHRLSIKHDTRFKSDATRGFLKRTTRKSPRTMRWR
jgi:hypothetical protein